ncbi:MAG: hypothetical protein S4CHLAM102_02670 [Chlamydiia bacterium]|nr:hypothetical protein [Chlamydiia bacterium]
MKLKMHFFSSLVVGLLIVQSGVFAKCCDKGPEEHVEDCCCPPVSDDFQGFSVNVGVGYSGVVAITDTSGLVPRRKTSYGGDGVGVQLKFSGDYAFCDEGVVGVEAYGQYNSAKTQDSYLQTAASTVKTRRTFKMPWNVGLDARVGYIPASCSMVFLYAGPDWGYYDFNYRTTGVSSSYKQFVFGGGGGGGLKQLFGECFHLQMTVDYRWYGSKTITYTNGESQKIKARLATALMMVGYTF